MPLNSIVIPAQRWYDENIGHFSYIDKDIRLKLEHSLLSIKKWERKWHVCYFDKTVRKTNVMLLDYIRCMSLDSSLDPKVLTRLTEDDMAVINKYINDPMTALNIPPDPNDDTDTDKPVNELFYYYMFSLGIPKECERWHINELLALIREFTYKNKKAEEAAEERAKRRTGKAPRKKQAKDYVDPVALASINHKRRTSIKSKG